MSNQPLQPFSPPTALFNQLHISGSVAASTVFQWVMVVIFLFWFVYTIVAVYHWLKYSQAPLVALPAIGVHLFVSFALMAYALTGTRII